MTRGWERLSDRQRDKLFWLFAERPEGSCNRLTCHWKHQRPTCPVPIPMSRASDNCDVGEGGATVKTDILTSLETGICCKRSYPRAATESAMKVSDIGWIVPGSEGLSFSAPPKRSSSNLALVRE